MIQKMLQFLFFILLHNLYPAVYAIHKEMLFRSDFSSCKEKDDEIIQLILEEFIDDLKSKWGV